MLILAFHCPDHLIHPQFLVFHYHNPLIHLEFLAFLQVAFQIPLLDLVFHSDNFLNPVTTLALHQRYLLLDSVLEHHHEHWIHVQDLAFQRGSFQMWTLAVY